MTVREMIVPERGIMIASRQGETLIAIATTVGEAAVTAVVAAGAGAGAKTASGIGTESGTETGIEIAVRARPSAELGPGAEVEVKTTTFFYLEVLFLKSHSLYVRFYLALIMICIFQ